MKNEFRNGTLSRIAALIPGHFVSCRSTGTERAEFEQQGGRDWETFWSLRARELRSGGRLVVVLPALSDDGISGFENVMDQANAVLGEMVAQGDLTVEDRARMVLGSHPRRKADLLAPFERDGQFQHLSVETLEMVALPDAAWTLWYRSLFLRSEANALWVCGR